MSPSKFLEVAFLRKNAYFETYSHQLEGVKNFVWGEIEVCDCVIVLMSCSLGL